MLPMQTYLPDGNANDVQSQQQQSSCIDCLVVSNNFQWILLQLKHQSCNILRKSCIFYGCLLHIHRHYAIVIKAIIFFDTGYRITFQKKLIFPDNICYDLSKPVGIPHYLFEPSEKKPTWVKAEFGRSISTLEIKIQHCSQQRTYLRKIINKYILITNPLLPLEMENSKEHPWIFTF